MKRGTIVLALSLLVLATGLPGSSAGGLGLTFVGGGSARGDLGPMGSDPIASASAALDRVSGRLGIHAPGFAFDSVRHSIVGVHVRGVEVRGGVPVEGTWAAVHAVDGRIVQVDARDSDLRGAPVSAPISRESAVAAALWASGASTPFVEPAVDRLLARHGGRLVDVYRVSLVSFAPAVAATVDVSSADASIVSIRDDRRFADGQATVFDPNAVVALRDKTLREPVIEAAGADANLDDPRLNQALTLLPVREYTSNPAELVAGRLTGPYVDVLGPGGLSINGAFLYTRGDPRFETLMAYTHIDRIQRYFQSLGFTGDASVNAEPQTVITHRVEGFDNSFYQPGNDLILYGAGGVDDAEDAEVIIHELGHAIHDDQVPGWGSTHEGGSMGEGWGDFLAAAYYAGAISGGFQDPCVADWDATSYSSANPPCLRRTDTNKRYPANMQNEVHADGEIWSSFLWDLRGLLKCPAEPPEDDPNWDTDPECRTPRSDSQIMSDRIIKLVLASHEFLTPSARFSHAVAALRTAAEALGRPDWIPLVDQAATARGLPLNP